MRTVSSPPRILCAVGKYSEGACTFQSLQFLHSISYIPLPHAVRLPSYTLGHLSLKSLDYCFSFLHLLTNPIRSFLSTPNHAQFSSIKEKLSFGLSRCYPSLTTNCLKRVVIWGPCGEIPPYRPEVLLVLTIWVRSFFYFFGRNKKNKSKLNQDLLHLSQMANF